MIVGGGKQSKEEKTASAQGTGCRVGEARVKEVTIGGREALLGSEGGQASWLAVVGARGGSLFRWVGCASSSTDCVVPRASQPAR